MGFALRKLALTATAAPRSDSSGSPTSPAPSWNHLAEHRLHGHTLAKVLDEFNYAKYTLKSDEVWNAELELAMSLREPGQWNPPPPNGAASRG